jgi:hypothetical protein
MAAKNFNKSNNKNTKNPSTDDKLAGARAAAEAEERKKAEEEESKRRILRAAQERKERESEDEKKRLREISEAEQKKKAEKEGEDSKRNLKETQEKKKNEEAEESRRLQKALEAEQRRKAEEERIRKEEQARANQTRPVNFALGDALGLGGGLFGPSDVTLPGGGLNAGGAGQLPVGAGGIAGSLLQPNIPGLQNIDLSIGGIPYNLGGLNGGLFPTFQEFPVIDAQINIITPVIVQTYLPPPPPPPTASFYSINTVGLPNLTVKSEQKNQTVPEIDSSKSLDFYEATSKYNKYLESYENLIAPSSVNEKLILNFQAFVNYKNFDDNKSLLEIDEKLKKHIFIDQTKPISTKKFDRILYNDNYFLNFINKLKIGSRNINSSLGRNNNIALGSLSSTINAETKEFMSNISLTCDILKDLNNTENFKNIFPFYNNIKIKYTKKSTFIRNLKKFNLEDEFLIYLTKIITNKYNKGLASEQNYYSFVSDSVEGTNQKYNIKLRFDPNFFVSDFLSDRSLLSREESDSIVLFKKDFYKEKGKFNNAFFYFATAQAIRNKPELESGDILAFRVEKIAVDDPTVKQQFIFLNDSDIETFDIVDTQIKYNTKYRYNIYAYRYDRIFKSDIPNENLVTNGFISEVKMNNSEIVLSVLDLPPLAPTFTTFLDRTDNKTVLFKIDNICGSNFEFPVLLDPDNDAIKINHIRAAFKLEPNSKLLYKNDDQPTKFEIFRLDTPPKKYEDFINNRLLSISGVSAFKDTIISNKKYYYCMRSIDVHNFFSNPSFIMQVEIVENSGVSYLESKIFDIETSFSPNSDLILEGKSKTVAFKKYLQIGPSFIQTLLKNLNLQEFINAPNPFADADLDQEIFGEAIQSSGTSLDRRSSISKSLYGKNYKLRVKSKKSGKVIDINFKFVLEKNILS